MTVNAKPMLPIMRSKTDEELDSGPIVVLNLLKLKEDTPENLEKYLEYVMGVMSGWGDVGMQPVYAGKFNELVFGGCGDWDYMLLVHYPTRRIWFDMMDSDEYAAIHHGREDSMKMAVLWFSDPVLPYTAGDVHVPGGAWTKVFEKIEARKAKA